MDPRVDLNEHHVNKVPALMWVMFWDILEIRQYKNDSGFEIAALFHHLLWSGEGKNTEISKLIFWGTDQSHSYILASRHFHHFQCDVFRVQAK